MLLAAICVLFVHVQAFPNIYSNTWPYLDGPGSSNNPWRDARFPPPFNPGPTYLPRPNVSALIDST